MNYDYQQNQGGSDQWGNQGQSQDPYQQQQGQGGSGQSQDPYQQQQGQGGSDQGQQGGYGQSQDPYEQQQQVNSAIDQYANKIPGGEQYAQQAKDITDSGLENLEEQAKKRFGNPGGMFGGGNQ